MTPHSGTGWAIQGEDCFCDLRCGDYDPSCDCSCHNWFSDAPEHRAINGRPDPRSNVEANNDGLTYCPKCSVMPPNHSTWCPLACMALDEQEPSA